MRWKDAGENQYHLIWSDNKYNFLPRNSIELHQYKREFIIFRKRMRINSDFMIAWDFNWILLSYLYTLYKQCFWNGCSIEIRSLWSGKPFHGEIDTSRGASYKCILWIHANKESIRLESCHFLFFDNFTVVVNRNSYFCLANKLN